MRRDRYKALAKKSKDLTTCWIQVLSAGKTGVERVVEEGERLGDWVRQAECRRKRRRGQRVSCHPRCREPENDCAIWISFLFDDRFIIDDVTPAVVGDGGVDNREQSAGKDEADDFFEFG